MNNFIFFYSKNHKLEGEKKFRFGSLTPDPDSSSELSSMKSIEKSRKTIGNKNPMGQSHQDEEYLQIIKKKSLSGNKSMEEVEEDSFMELQNKKFVAPITLEANDQRMSVFSKKNHEDVSNLQASLTDYVSVKKFIDDIN